ncbi:MAG: PH domain-containing protein [Clostridium sp.]|uniref:PH domain-containing protein n=1 Tax=Clostridium sp. TaxID=1506 RepID=UPI003EE60DFD
MFGKIAADALGLSDIGKVIEPGDFNKVESDDYILHEDGEKIFFLIKSKSDEYCFTNRALIHVDGDNAVSKKRNLYRYEYYLNHISNVSLETAGNIDLDVEIKFQIGDRGFSIDVDKKQLERLKDLYKSLLRIGMIQRDNNLIMNIERDALKRAEEVFAGDKVGSSDIARDFKAITEFSSKWLIDSIKNNTVRDFAQVFELYINN